MKIEDTLFDDGSTFMNPEFLNSDEARGIRILSEFFHPEHIFKKHHIESTIIFFGGSRIKSEAEYLKEYNFLIHKKALTGLEEKKQLSSKQKKIASAASPEDKITGADFTALQAAKKK